MEHVGLWAKGIPGGGKGQWSGQEGMLRGFLGERAGAEGAAGRAMGLRAEGGGGPEAELVDHGRDTSLLQRGGMLSLEQRRGWLADRHSAQK